MSDSTSYFEFPPDWLHHTQSALYNHSRIHEKTHPSCISRVNETIHQVKLKTLISNTRLPLVLFISIYQGKAAPYVYPNHQQKTKKFPYQILIHVCKTVRVTNHPELSTTGVKNILVALSLLGPIPESIKHRPIRR